LRGFAPGAVALGAVALGAVALGAVGPGAVAQGTVAPGNVALEQGMGLGEGAGSVANKSAMRDFAARALMDY
jgi:hypothetical protein